MKKEFIEPNQPINKTVVVVDDEPDIVELVLVNLRKNGFKAEGFNSVQSLLDYIKKETPDLILLDIMLPDADGFEVCKYIKGNDKFSGISVIMLTARSDEMDKVLCLEMGADDYITKPFSPREMIARIKAVLRRNQVQPQTMKLEVSDSLMIDLQKYEVYVDGVKTDLTTTEFKILRLMSERKGWVYSREQILDHLGVNEKGVLDRTVDVHIKNLREKLGDAGKLIKNIRGIGYKIEV